MSIPNPNLAAHPWWCDPTACRADEAPQLDESGDLALASRGTEVHQSATVVVPRQRFDEVLISAHVTADGYEPIDETRIGADLVLTRTTFVSTETYALTGYQVRELVAMLGGLLPALSELDSVRRREDVEADGCTWWCSGGHAPDYPTCHREVAGFTLAAGTTAAVEVHQWDIDAATVTIYEHTADETVVTTISPAAAREFGLALLGAAGLAEGGAR